MRKLLTYCNDVTKLLAEVAQTMPAYVGIDDQGIPASFVISKSRTQRLGFETLSVVLCTTKEAADIAALKSIVVFANVARTGDLHAAMAATDLAVYDRIYDQTPQEIVDDSGAVIGTATPPALFADFA